MTALNFIHRFERGARPNSRPLLILHGTGARDPVAPPANGARLKGMLEQAGADVVHKVLAAGHELSQKDVVSRESGCKRRSPRFQRLPEEKRDDDCRAAVISEASKSGGRFPHPSARWSARFF
jgi:hypothetical protein